MEPEIKIDESILNIGSDSSNCSGESATAEKPGLSELSTLLTEGQNSLEGDWKRRAYEILRNHQEELEGRAGNLPVNAILLLGDIYLSFYDLDNARKWFERARDCGYDNYRIWLHLGVSFMQSGRIDEGMEVYRRLGDEETEKLKAVSQYLFGCHYDPEISREKLFGLHKEWGQLVREKISVRKIDYKLKRSGKIRVGYVSADFRDHSVAFFAAPLIGGHDRNRFEVFGYGNVKDPDSITERMAGGFDQYKSIYDMNDDVTADMIVEDGIDILVDLGGHTNRNRLLMFAQRPAPIQVTYLGYPNTTGLDVMDYRLTDPVAESAGCERYCTEKPVFLPGGFLCYKAFNNMPEVGEPAMKKNGYITFGSFNNNAKVNPYVIGLWSQVLNCVEGSKLILKLKHGDNEFIRESFLGMFEENGVRSDRIEIYNHLSKLEHYQLYNQIDIALDTYPYCGTTTSCEGMWMGVPVVSLSGKHHMSRVGASLLNKVGLGYFAAETEREYIAKAAALASDIESLAKIRASMRERMVKSGLCEGTRFVREIEAAYEQMIAKYEN